MAPYFIRNLIPRREARSGNRRPLLEALRSITWIQWAQFVSGFVSFPPTSLSLEGLDSFVRWLAWSCDAIDFFSVSLSVTRLQQQFHKAEASTIVRFLHLGYSPFAPSLRMNVDAVTVYPDTSHHVDASIPVCRRRKCFLVTWCRPFLVHMLGAASNLAWSGRQIPVLAMNFLPLPRCPGARL